jgi:type I site-specific restriction endonuclease
LEDFETRKSRENARIEEEIEKIRAHYAQRIQNNLDQVAKEKDALRNWQNAMQHESQRIAEVIELCGKQPAPPRPNALAVAAGAQGSAEKTPLA